MDNAQKNSWDFLSGILNAIADPVFVKGRQHHWVFLNDAFCKFIGHPLIDLLGKSDYDFFPKYQADVSWEMDEVVFSSGIENVNEEEFTDADGIKRTIITKKTCYTAPDGQQFLVGTIRDITERKAAEEVLRTTEERTRLFFERQLVGMAIVSPKNGWIQVNDKICEILGYTREELAQHTWAELTYPDDLAANMALFEQMRNGEIDSYTLEKRYMRKDGSIIFTNLAVGCVRRADGSVDYILALLEDISERKRAELERETHAYFLECMDRVNRAIQGTNDLEQMMRDVLDIVLSIFDCDRAFLVYPCDPDVVEFKVPMECTKPEYPGALTLGEAVPMSKEMAAMFRAVLSVAGPVKLGPEAEYPLPPFLSEQYDVKSELVMALHPKQDMPWQFGLHQCSHARVWSHADERLLKEIGRRLEDALTSLLMYRNLQASEQKFRSLAENMPDTLIRYDREGRRTYINPALIRISAVRVEQMISLTQQESNPFTMPEIYRLALEHTLATGERSELELAILTPSGDVRTNLVFIVAERAADGQVSGAITIGHDITERKQAEKELLESESRFRTLFESATDGMLILGMDGRIDDINRTGHERLGYTKQEMLGRRIAEFDTPEYAATVPERLAEIAVEEKSIFESAHVCKDGTVMPVEINTRMIQLDGEQRYFSVVRDITERKNAEQQLRKLSAYLQIIREEEKAHLSREVHDELGSILSALKIEIHLLDRGLSADQKKMPLFARVGSMVELFDEALKAMRRIVTDLRPTIIEDLGLMAALDWQAEQFSKHTGIECQIACIYRKEEGCEDCKDCEHTQDKTLSINLFRIFQESLTNVARHSGASSVAVELQPCVHEVALSIRDNGCGLPEGHVIAPTSNGIRGMRERVAQLGGKIEFDKPLGGGFRVMVRLPQATNSRC